MSRKIAEQSCMFYVKKVLRKKAFKTHEIQSKVEELSNADYEYKTIYNRLHDLEKAGKAECFFKESEGKKGNIYWKKS